nr:reverse transcriptase zinc-binding domain-containing protein [Tanacetum cinerariifolium]
MCMSYMDVAQVANAARNYEILHERDDDDTERPDKRDIMREGFHHHNYVADLVLNCGWIWPQSWLLKAPNLGEKVWEALRPWGNEVVWNVRLSMKELRDIIMVTVRLKLLTFRFKNTAMVNHLPSRWKMPKTFRIHGC